MSDDDAPAEQPPRPLLRIVRGEPSPEELAALIAVVSAARAGAAPAPERLRSSWNDPARLVRRPVHPGHGGWHRSSLPG